jgi:hypothetical protein
MSNGNMEMETEFGSGKSETKFCSICRVAYTGWGNNAWPINDGRCCDRCNQDQVIPARLDRMRKTGRPPSDR